MSYRGHAQGLEARWNANGAICLQTPRIDANPSAAGAAAFPLGGMASVLADCPSPPPA
jgi:hypothetical protein